MRIFNLIASYPKMAFTKVTVETRFDNLCAGWVGGTQTWDVERNLHCDAVGQQLWLVFFILMTALCVQHQFFRRFSKFTGFCFTEITFILLLWILYWLSKLDMAWNWVCDGILYFLIALSLLGTYANSLHTGQNDTIFELRCLAFGGRGPGLLSRARNTAHSTYPFDSTRGFPGEGWSIEFPQLKMVTWNCRSLTVERMSYCRALGFDILALTEL